MDEPRRVAWLCGIVATGVLLFPGGAHAFEVLGCSLRPGENPSAFISCVQRAADQRANDARRDVERKLDDERKRAEKLDKELKQARQRAAELESRLPVGPAEIGAVDAARKLKLQPLFACLDASGASAQLRADITLMATDPAAAAKVIFHRTWTRMESSLDALLAEDLEKLTALSPPGEASDATARAMRRFQALVTKDPALTCVAKHFEGGSAALRQAAQEITAEVRQRTTALFEEKVRPLIEKAAFKALDAVLAKVLAQLPRPPGNRANVRTTSGTRSSALESTSGATSGETTGTATTGAAPPLPPWLDVLMIDPEAIATRAYVAGMLLPRIENITAKLGALNTAVAGGNPATVASAAKALRDAYADDPGTTAVVEMEIGLGIIKAIGTRYIESNGVIFGVPGGGVLWDGFYEAFSLGVNVGYQVMDGTSGLIPEIGAYICALVIAVLQVTEKQPAGAYAKAALKWATLKGVSAVWGKLVDDVGAELIKNTGPGANAALAREKAKHPALAFLLDRLQPEVIRFLGASYLDRLKQSTRRYDDGVQAMLNGFVPASP